jgi:hypothetical protein
MKNKLALIDVLINENTEVSQTACSVIAQSNGLLSGVFSLDKEVKLQ